MGTTSGARGPFAFVIFFPLGAQLPQLLENIRVAHPGFHDLRTPRFFAPADPISTVSTPTASIIHHRTLARKHQHDSAGEGQSAGAKIQL